VALNNSLVCEALINEISSLERFSIDGEKFQFFSKETTTSSLEIPKREKQKMINKLTNL
jgi:hypothetical protein